MYLYSLHANFFPAEVKFLKYVPFNVVICACSTPGRILQVIKNGKFCKKKGPN